MSKHVYDNAPDGEILENKIQLSVGDIFIYSPNQKISVVENLKIIWANIQHLLSDRPRPDFIIKVEVMTSLGEKKAVVEMTESALKSAVENSYRLYDNELIPAGVGQDGETIYKRRNTIRKESEDGKSEVSAEG